MLIPENIEAKLRFEKIREEVSAACLTSIGKGHAEAMSFMTDLGEVRRQVGMASEMASILESDEDFPASELPDLRDSLKRIRVEGLYLNEEELMALRVALTLSISAIDFFEQAEEGAYPLLREASAGLAPYPLTINQIDRILGPDGQIKDTASGRLAEIRGEIKSQETAAARRLNAIMQRAQSMGLVESDAAITVRDGVAVIPIPAANKRMVEGIVVDESSTGRTAFVQPAEVVAINTRIRELRSEERREIIQILKDMASNIRPYAPDMIRSIETLGLLDFQRGKAVYGKQIDATRPTIDEEPGLYLSGARHPLLMAQLAHQGKRIVPLNIELNAPAGRILVISGPNAGGKSVCLQTVGLLQMMLQSGLLVPVNEGSRMCVFDSLFIDIGDNQSIENDLSTYSSHLMAMKNFVRSAGRRTLILIDEFGTGTEPLMGGAIAEAVLAELNRLGAFGVLTTHYTNLKHFASQTEGLVNGAMTFDTHRIEPLFSLHIGQPGSSFAFEIARKIGLPERILSDAKEKMGQENADYDRNLRQINRDKHYWEQKRQNVKENDKKLAETLQKYNEMLEGIKAERREILAKAREEAKSLLAETNRRIEATIKEIRESQAEKERTKEVRKELEAFREETEGKAEKEDGMIERKMEQIRQRQKRQKEREKSAPAAQEKMETREEERPLQAGDYVSIDGDGGRIGQVMELRGKEAQVAMGSMVSNIKLSRLKRVSSNAARRAAGKPLGGIDYSNVATTVREKKLIFSSEIDVRGMRAEEALQRVGSFMDEALLCEVGEVRILHGKGNGILRDQIRKMLRTLPYVEGCRDESEQFGGAGITVVELG